MQKTQKYPLVVIVGQTASGKTALSIELAKALDGEVISADSRQVYKELNLISGKVTKEEMQSVPHHLLDVLSLKDGAYSAYDFARGARLAILDIIKRDRLPIIAGGTGFYIDAALGKVELGQKGKDFKLRDKLEKESSEELFRKLQKLDPKRADKIDKNNKRRLIRAIELASGSKEGEALPELPELDVVWIGLRWGKETLRERIKQRLKERFECGMCSEIKSAMESKVGESFIESLGLEAKYCLYFLKGELVEQDFLQTLENKIWQYAKRQATYWRRNKDIKWFEASDFDAILEYVKRVL